MLPKGKISHDLPYHKNPYDIEGLWESSDVCADVVFPYNTFEYTRRIENFCRRGDSSHHSMG